MDDDWDKSLSIESVSSREILAAGSDEHREKKSNRGMRESIGIWLIGLLCAIVTLSFTGIFLDDDPQLMEGRFKLLKQFLDVIIGPVVTLLSSVIGFYFGSQAAQKVSKDGTDDRQ